MIAILHWASCTGRPAFLDLPPSTCLPRPENGEARTVLAPHQPRRRTFGSLIFADMLAGAQTSYARSGEGAINLAVLLSHHSASYDPVVLRAPHVYL